MADETPGKWETTVYLMTGYKVPTRDSVTEDLKGKSRKYGDADDNAVDAPWIDVTISNVGKVDGTALANRLASRGDFLLFYAGTGDGGPMTNAKKLNLYVVRIGFPWQRGSGQAGTNFQKYSLGSNAAISQLSYPPYRTTGFSFDGLSVAEEDAVDLGTFSHRARSIDRAMAFFDQHEQRLKTWTDSMDGPGAAWQGNAAGVFQNLITTLHTQYKHYKEQLAPPGFSAPLESKVDHYRPRTYHGAGLVRAEMALSVGLRTLKVAFDDWHSDKGTVSGTAPDGSATTAAAHWDPEVTVRGVLQEVAQWINANNAGKVVTHSTTYGSTGSSSGGDDYWYDTMAGFKENVPVYGPLTDPNTWVKIAQEAVSRWKNNVVAHLDPAAETAQTGLAEAWSKLLNTAWDPDYGFEEAPAATLSSTGNSGGNSNSTFNPNDIASLFNNQNASVNDALNNITGSMNNALNDQNQALNDIGGSTNNALNDLFSGGSGTTDSALNDTGLTGTPDVNGLLSDTAGTGDTGSGGTSDTAAGVSPAYTSLLNGALNSLGSGGSGSTKVNPDGSITVTNADGSTTTTRPDGTEVTTFPDGSTSTTGPDGRTTLVDADGSTSVQNADGTVTTTFPDGSKVTLGPDGSYTNTSANGTVTHGDLQPGQSITNPDGSTTKVNADGSVTTTFPDGLVGTLKPDGTYTVDQPDGSGIDTSSLGGGTSTTVPAPHGSTGTVNTSLNGSLNGGLSSGGSSGLPLTDSATDGDFLYDDVPYTSSLSGALGAAPGTDGFSAGTGLNPGALAAASRAGAMNGDLSGSERVRSGFADTDSAVTGSPRTTSAGSRAAAAAEEAAAARTATSSSGAPFFPGAGAGPGGQSTQSEDRTRTTWLSEDEEVWGTEDGGVPAVLGRDD